MQRLSQRGIEVPRAVSVVGFDNIFAAGLCTPGLTTLGGVHADVGRAAVEILLDAVDPTRTASDPPSGDAADRAGPAGHHRARTAVTRGHARERPIPCAATRRPVTNRDLSRLRFGTTTPTAATTTSSGPARIGTATEQAPSVISSTVVA